MCGFIGANYNININDKILNHRGPDDFDIYRDKSVILSHNRLSILDLGQRSKQPFFYKNYVLVFNGEIYNYQDIQKSYLEEYEFITSSDTEVLIKAYDKFGRSCLEYFNGDFAFCIYDKSSKKLFCARDRVGNKPFYYYFYNDKFIFSSELSTFKNFINLDFNIQKLGDSILFSMNDNDEYTIYKNIYNLLPAHYLEFDLRNNSLKVDAYWSIENNNIDKPFIQKEFNNKLEEFEELFDSAVRLRLIADVKVGSMLSGGVDSSIVAYFIDKYDKDTEFYSIIYDEFKNIDESYFINIMKSKFNLNINYLKPKFEDLRNDFDDLLRTQSDIFRSLSIYVQYYLFKNIDKNIKVMLSGQGADELFGGYYHHVARYLPNSKEEYKNRLKVYGQQAKKELELGLKFCLDDNNKLNKLKNDNINNLKIVNEVLNSYIPNYNYLIDKFDSSFSSCLIKETTKNNLPMLLRFEDRNAMRFSIENRTPFTDYKVIEFAHSLPNSYKVHNGFSKYFLREFSNKFLPQEISFRVDKKGFEAPEEAWIKKLGFSGNLVDFRLNIYKGLLDA